MGTGMGVPQFGPISGSEMGPNWVKWWTEWSDARTRPMLP